MSRTLAGLANTAQEKSIPAVNALVLHVPVGAEREMIDQLRAQAGVDYAEPDYEMHMLR